MRRRSQPSPPAAHASAAHRPPTAARPHPPGAPPRSSRSTRPSPPTRQANAPAGNAPRPPSGAHPPPAYVPPADAPAPRPPPPQATIRATQAVWPELRQRPQRLGLIRIGLQHPETVMIGPRQLAQHERIEPIRLPARGPEPITRRRDLVGMQRQHPQPRVQQPLDQKPIGPLNRDQPHPVTHQGAAQAPHPASSCANVAARTSSPVSSAISTSCFSDAQSTPA